MNVNKKRSAKGIKIVFAVLMLLYVAIVGMIYFVDWAQIYVFSDSPAVVLIKKRKANALKQIVQSKQRFQSSFSKINKQSWAKYYPKVYRKLSDFLTQIKGQTSPTDLLPFERDLRMNLLLITHYNGLVNKKIIAENKRVLVEQVAAKKRLKLANQKVAVGKRKLTARKQRQVLLDNQLIAKRDHFILIISQQAEHKDIWERVAQKQYAELTNLSTRVKGLKGEALRSKEMDIDAAMVTFNYYKLLVTNELDRIGPQVAKKAKANGFPIVLKLDKLSISQNKDTIHQQSFSKLNLEKIELEYKRFLTIKLYDSASFLASYKRLSVYFIEAFKSPLSTPEVEQILVTKKEVERRRNRAEQVAHVLMRLKVVKVNEKGLSPQYLAAVEKSGYPIEVKNDLGLHFRFIPAGSFLMGSPEKESDRDADELQHKVKISKPFYMQISELSQKQFHFQKDSDLNSIALVKVTQKMAIEFCRRMNLNALLLEDRYDLPTEAQWEYACRATTRGPHYANNLKEIAFYDYGYSGKISKRGLLKPNAWGLYDMLGNAKEICRDQLSSSFFFTKPPKTYQKVGTIVDPVGSDGSEMVLRGGGWTSSSSSVRAANREVVDAEYKLWDAGFRVIYKLD